MTRLFALLTFALLAACDAQVHSTSGAGYLNARSGPVDPAIAAAAAVEPDLQFPARIGLVRLVYNDLTIAPASEAEAWNDLITRTDGFGTFVPITRLGALRDVNRRDIMDRLRETAAAQQIDYILVADMDVSRGTAQLSFVDVRNGYIYGTAQAASTSGGENGFWGGRISNPGRLDRATARLANALIPEAEDLLTQLAAASQQ